VRSLASWALNLTLAIVFVVLLHTLLACAGVYLPIELSVIVVFAVLAVVRRRVAPRIISNPRVRLIAARIVLCTAAVLIVVQVIGQTVTYSRGRSFAADAARMAAKTSSTTSEQVVDVRSLDSATDARLGAWLADHGADPADYAIRTAAAHQVTLFGEMHDLHENLAFFDRIVPELYTRAGVSVICLECCVFDQNADLDRLVNAKQFDRALQRKIAREASWPCWGFSEYWDVLETVWRVNQARAPNAPAMRVVGIFPRVDMPSLALFKGGPAIERLRGIRSFWNIAPLAVHDGLYAREIERATFEQNARGVVWVGASHASLVHRHPITMGDKLAGEMPRMGNLLYARYGDRVAAITMHYAETRQSMAAAIERAVAASGRTSVGFDVTASPLAVLRDGESIDYRYQPAACLADLSPGYILLRPAGKLTRCAWMNDYVSTPMFSSNRPFYEMIAERKLRSAADFNAFAAANAFRF